ncbi:MAG: DinB family protein [Chlorobiaceae bacterium]|nr:DinB family protein [Chlorobiaceae bacterium]
MNWKQLLTQQLGDAFRVTERLTGLLQEKDLLWKPPEGSNWMTTAQLLWHLGESCGGAMRGFVTGEWNIPDHSNMEGGHPEKSALPKAEQLRAVHSIDEAMKRIASDKALAIEVLNLCSEEELDSKPAPAPWDPNTVNLGLRLLQMIDHLNQHKAQLFYYLKLQGKPVNTFDLYGK